jgi:glycosyltransferase involved in cell wall biosynthesis
MPARSDHALGLTLPFFNEGDCCEAVVESTHRVLSAVGEPFSLALVDNGSSDSTGSSLDQLAERLPNCHVVHLQENAGYGGGILAGLTLLKEPIIGWHWGDGQISPETVVAAWQLMIQRPFQMVKAARVTRHDGASRARVSALYARACQHLLTLESPDVNGCPKLFRRALFDQLNLRSSDWLLDLEAVSKVEALNVRIGCVDAVMRARSGGQSKVQWSTIAEFTLAIARIRWSGPPWA